MKNELEKNLHYKILFNELTSPVCIFNVKLIEGDISYKNIELVFNDVNSSFEKNMGIDKDEISGQLLKEEFPEFYKKWREPIYKAFIDKETVHFDFYSKNDGKHYDVKFFYVHENKVIAIATDISVHKSVEIDLLESEEKYKYFIENASETIFRNDYSGNFTYINASGVTLLGYKQLEFLNMNYRDLVAPEYIDKVTDFYRDQLKFDKDETYDEWVVINKDGSQIWLGVNARAVRQRDGKIEFYSIARDITKEKDAEFALMNSEKKYHELVDSLPEIIFELDFNGNITYVNERTIELLGYSREQILNTYALNLIKEEQYNRASKGITDTLKGDRFFTQEFSFVKSDGSLIPFHVFTSPVIEEGTSVGIRGIAVDITLFKKAESALRESEEKFRTMIENSFEIITIVDGDGIVKYQSQSFERLTGYNPEEVIGANVFDIVHPEDLENVKKLFFTTIENGDKFSRVEYRIKHKNGLFKTFETIGSNMLDNPAVRGIVLNVRDITDRKRADEALFQSVMEHKKLYESALVGMLTARLKDGIVLYTNILGFELFGYKSKIDFIGKVSVNDLFTDDDIRKNLHDELMESESHVVKREIQFNKIDDKTFWGEVTATLNDDTLEYIITDISAKKELQEQTEYLEMFDHQVTGLPNLDNFTKQLDERLLSSSAGLRHAVVSLCVDGLEDVKIIHGPSASDELLKTIAESLNTTIFRNDLIAFDRDKFIILIQNIGVSEYNMYIDSVIQKILNLFSSSFMTGNNSVQVTPGIGIAISPKDGNTRDSLLKNCESAMHISKNSGGNNAVFYNPKMHEELIHRINLEKELKNAIDNNEFRVLFQPKVDKEGKIKGMESLIRWNSPVRGILSPSHFISLAERSGLIVDIGYEVLKISCEQNKRWQEMGLEKMASAVNLSPFQFSQPDLIYQIGEIVKRSGLDPQWLELEITESGIMENEQEGIDKLNSLKDMGFSIAIDDFGTGYSSLSKLQDYPIDTLKVDRSFINNILENPKTAAITKYTINLAHDLGFKVVTEGVESREQFEFLKEFNCEMYQGFYFSEPLSALEFEKLLKDKTNRLI